MKIHIQSRKIVIVDINHNKLFKVSPNVYCTGAPYTPPKQTLIITNSNNNKAQSMDSNGVAFVWTLFPFRNEKRYTLLWNTEIFDKKIFPENSVTSRKWNAVVSIRPNFVCTLSVWMMFTQSNLIKCCLVWRILSICSNSPWTGVHWHRDVGRMGWLVIIAGTNQTAVNASISCCKIVAVFRSWSVSPQDKFVK